MPVSGLEALADAGMHVEGWFPNTLSYSNRNPGNLRASAHPHTMDTHGFCVFPNFLTGYDALLAELRGKVTGANSHGIGPQSTLAQLYAVYAPASDNNQPLRYAANVAAWCSTALGRTITPQTTLRAVCPELFEEAK